jgi:hypothetical protein
LYIYAFFGTASLTTVDVDNVNVVVSPVIDFAEYLCTKYWVRKRLLKLLEYAMWVTQHFVYDIVYNSSL